MLKPTLKKDAGNLMCDVVYNGIEWIAAVIRWYDGDGSQTELTTQNAFRATTTCRERRMRRHIAAGSRRSPNRLRIYSFQRQNPLS